MRKLLNRYYVIIALSAGAVSRDRHRRKAPMIAVNNFQEHFSTSDTVIFLVNPLKKIPGNYHLTRSIKCCFLSTVKHQEGLFDQKCYN